jgi:uroporphyrin-III C-methyltransferase
MNGNDEEQKPSSEETATEAGKDATPEQPAVARPARSRNTVAWLALLLSFVAVAAAAYFAIDDWRQRRAAAHSVESIADLDSRLASSGESVENLRSTIARLTDDDARMSEKLASLEQQFADRKQTLDSLLPRLGNLESDVSALQGASAGARTSWLVAEAEHYLRIANAELQLASDPDLATLALKTADDRLAQLGDPAMIDVRQAIADELAALDAMDKPDVEGVTLTLASLSRVVETLPLKAVRADKAEGGAEPEPEAGAFARAWASLKRAASGLVKVSKPGEGAIPLLSPDAEYFLRTNLELKLEVARLALLRGEQAAFRQSLDDATTWLGEYFESGNTQVKSAIDTIAELRDGVKVSAPPDISESLRLLRQHRAASEPAQ